jgi:hypothetical protein
MPARCRYGMAARQGLSGGGLTAAKARELARGPRRGARERGDQARRCWRGALAAALTRPDEGGVGVPAKARRAWGCGACGRLPRRRRAWRGRGWTDPHAPCAPGDPCPRELERPTARPLRTRADAPAPTPGSLPPRRGAAQRITRRRRLARRSTRRKGCPRRARRALAALAGVGLQDTQSARSTAGVNIRSDAGGFRMAPRRPSTRPGR